MPMALLMDIEKICPQLMQPLPVGRPGLVVSFGLYNAHITLHLLKRPGSRAVLNQGSLSDRGIRIS